MMYSKSIMFFGTIFTMALCAMDTRAPQSPGPQGSSRATTTLPESPQSPGERRIRQEHLVHRLGQQINPAIYAVLPRAHAIPPHLNVPTEQIVNDWFFDHMTAEQLAIINRVAGVIRQRPGTRVSLTGDDVQLYLDFPSLISEALRPYLSIPEIENAITEPDTSTSVEASARPGNKKRKRSDTSAR